MANLTGEVDDSRNVLYIGRDSQKEKTLIVGIPKEIREGETRVPVIPQTAKKMIDLGMQVRFQAGCGTSCRIKDSAYTEIGADIVHDRNELLESADLILRINKPPLHEVDRLKKGSVHISYLDPFNEKETVTALVHQGVQAVSMELIPRTTRAQKMDSLSSQASLAGYVAVVLAADYLDAIFPMMTTPAGTIYPARAFIIGAGVAGLQAIATARRLGARVEAFDTRPVVEEQVQSLGARFVKVDLGEQGQTKDGYARELTPEQLEQQRKVMADHCASADIVITTAQVFGRKAPLIVTEEMVDGMKPGSVIVDMAVESGGNVALSEPDKSVEVNGVTILGTTNLAGRVPVAASQMYSSNLFGLIEEFWDAEEERFWLDPEDEIVQGCLLSRDGHLVNSSIKELYS